MKHSSNIPGKLAKYSAIDVTYIADMNVLLPLSASLASLVAHANAEDPVNVRVLTFDVPRQEFLSIVPASASWGSVSQIPVSQDLLEQVPKPGDSLSDHYTKSVYGTLFLDELLPEAVHRTIYIDCDTLILASLRELWEIELGECVLGAVQDRYVSTVSSPYGIGAWRELGLLSDKPYFNSGVMLVDVHGWRSLNIAKLGRLYLAMYGLSLTQNDQEVLNALLVDRWVKIDERWNVSNYWRLLSRVREDGRNLLPLAMVRHFAGDLKPWTAAGIRELPDADLFFKYLRSVDRWSEWTH